MSAAKAQTYGGVDVDEGGGMGDWRSDLTTSFTPRLRAETLFPVPTVSMREVLEYMRKLTFLDCSKDLFRLSLVGQRVGEWHQRSLERFQSYS